MMNEDDVVLCEISQVELWIANEGGLMFKGPSKVHQTDDDDTVSKP